MAYAAFIVAVVSLFVAYLAVRRIAVLQQHLAAAENKLAQAKAEFSATSGKLEARLQELSADARPRTTALQFLPSMTIAEAMATHPGVSDVLANFKLTGCSSCAISDVDTLEGACKSYGIDERQLMSALSRLLGPEGPGNLVKMAQARGRAAQN